MRFKWLNSFFSMLFNKQCDAIYLTHIWMICIHGYHGASPKHHKHLSALFFFSSYFLVFSIGPTYGGFFECVQNIYVLTMVVYQNSSDATFNITFNGKIPDKIKRNRCNSSETIEKVEGDLQRNLSFFYFKTAFFFFFHVFIQT